MPDLRLVVDRIAAQPGTVLTTKEGAGRFTEACALALNTLDRSFGHLRKPASRNHVVGPDGNLHAVDVVLYRATGQIIDIIVDAGGANARATWNAGPVGEYGAGDWYAPVSVAPVPFPVPPTPPAPIPAPLPPKPAEPVISGELVYAQFVDLKRSLEIATATQEQILLQLGQLRVLVETLAARRAPPAAYVGALAARLRLTPE